MTGGHTRMTPSQARAEAPAGPLAHGRRTRVKRMDNLGLRHAVRPQQPPCRQAPRSELPDRRTLRLRAEQLSQSSSLTRHHRDLNKSRDSPEFPEVATHPRGTAERSPRFGGGQRPPSKEAQS